MAAPLLPANRTTPIAAWIAVRTPGSAENVLRGALVADLGRRPPGSTTTMIARSQKTLSVAEASQTNENLKLSPRA